MNTDTVEITTETGTARIDRTNASGTRSARVTTDAGGTARVRYETRQRSARQGGAVGTVGAVRREILIAGSDDDGANAMLVTATVPAVVVMLRKGRRIVQKFEYHLDSCAVGWEVCETGHMVEDDRPTAYLVYSGASDAIERIERVLRDSAVESYHMPDSKTRVRMNNDGQSSFDGRGRVCPFSRPEGKARETVRYARASMAERTVIEHREYRPEIARAERASEPGRKAPVPVFSHEIAQAVAERETREREALARRNAGTAKRLDISTSEYYARNPERAEALAPRRMPATEPAPKPPTVGDRPRTTPLDQIEVVRPVAEYAAHSVAPSVPRTARATIQARTARPTKPIPAEPIPAGKDETAARVAAAIARHRMKRRAMVQARRRDERAERERGRAALTGKVLGLLA